MAIHVDVSFKSLDNLRTEARNRGTSVRQLASDAMETMFNGDRSQFLFTPALPPEMLPKCEFLFNALVRDPKLFSEIHDLVKQKLETVELEDGEIEAEPEPEEENVTENVDGRV